jgi:predicted 2-oxoglutarate/Fe(II)-dependent dioxygenase YbiX
MPNQLYKKNGDFIEDFRGVAMRRFCPEPPGAGELSKAIAPPGILVIEGFLGIAKCEDFCNFIAKQETRQLPVLNAKEFESSRARTYEVNPQRVTDTIDLGERKTDMLREVVRGYQHYVTRFFKAGLDTFEPPQVLKYSVGGRYLPHADNEHWDPATKQWARSMERDYSLLLYLNDGYEGGALYFPNFKWAIQPKRGMLVSFPSDHRYLHGAAPLISGTRIAVASWAKAKTPQLFDPVAALASSTD